VDRGTLGDHTTPRWGCHDELIGFVSACARASKTCATVLGQWCQLGDGTSGAGADKADATLVKDFP